MTAKWMQGCPPEEEEARMEVFRNQLQENGQPNTFRQAVLAACMDMQELLTLASTNAWLQVQLGQIQNIPGIFEYLQQLNAQNPENLAVPVPLLTVQLAALGLAAEPSYEEEPQMAPHAASVWDMIAVCSIVNHTSLILNEFCETALISRAVSSVQTPLFYTCFELTRSNVVLVHVSPA